MTGSPAGVHDGASATASIIYKQAANVLTVPSAAVHTEGKGSFVYLAKSGTKTKQAVTTGLSSSGTTQIVSGLSSGQKVYVTTIKRTTGTGAGTGTGTGGGAAGNAGPGNGTGGFPGGGTGGLPGAGAGNGGPGGGQ